MAGCLEASGNNTKAWILRIATLLVGGFLVASSGPVLGFTAYAPAYKATYNLTQTQVEWSMSIAVLGHNMGFHVHWLQVHIGPRLTALSGGAILALGFGLLYSSTYTPEFYHDNPFLLHLYCFIMGLGCVTAVFIAMGVCPYNFSQKNRGKAIGIMDFSYNLGTAIVAIIFYSGFADFGNSAPVDQDLAGFFLFNLVSWGVAGILGSIFLTYVPPEDPSEIEDIITDVDSINKSLDTVVANNNNENKEEEVEEASDSIPVLQALKQPEYLVLLWYFAAAGGVQIMFFDNITTFLVSTGNSQYSFAFTVFAATLTATMCVVISAVSDAIRKVPRIAFVLMASLAQFVCNIILTFLLENIYVYGVCLAIFAVCDSTTWPLVQTIISELWGEQYFTSHLTLFFLSTAATNAILQALLGYFYDARISDEVKQLGGTHCYGTTCFTNVFIISSVLQFTGLICLFYLRKKHLKSYCNRALEAAKSEVTPLITNKDN